MSFLDNKKSLIFWTIFSLVLSVIFIFGALYYGIEASYTSRTIFSWPFAILSLILSLLSFLFFLYLFVKAFLKDGRVGIIIAAILALAIFAILFIFSGGRLFKI
ncbi:MAG: hypothetical protein A2402_00280 [Candidatus Staskawiczbacteria bacterium RIFOXYC1_FULL_37_43]|nr:MAG: hypothetical protein A2813_01010 [Candidatus Staskawiczbacteria bacterium RIFCSPHIGHO2_01_FULL_37_17]OGZ71839.1 MAG: hypothetical protein A2891_01575 [Candidatus Staskawiczbacteria bacterium RIFCSPLOWO2_01_FULL_37_19]OGZ76064.1 MAG: hypothetical protein A2205_03345 [Candidatus Staskawiczbacteria bacterium RIFOXYA1_FULL_37_15]OGZ77853.1 MAG: hypothetical protein A2280_03590 [Candidatus Staskawiczbacteria bacterium RIFOXYA12_FULL_37_10]OGZ80031.1 MAG: hypothetical protein A2353_02070 [Can